MFLLDYIDMLYGSARGNKARFLKDNPDILPQELSRWLKAGLKIRADTGEIYKPVSRRVRVPSAIAAGADVFITDDLRERVASLATAQNVTTDAMLNALVEREELCRKLSPVADSGIAGIVSRHFAALSEHSETVTWHRVLEALIRELIESDLLSFHSGNIAESRRNKYLNNLVEQDHRNIKRRTRLMLGFNSFRRAQTLLAGIELVLMIRKGQYQHPHGDGLSPAEQFYLLAA